MARNRPKRGNETTPQAAGNGRGTGQGQGGNNQTGTSPTAGNAGQTQWPYQGPWQAVVPQVTTDPGAAGGGGGGGGAGGAGGAGAPPEDVLNFDPALERYLSGLQGQGDIAQANAGAAMQNLYGETLDPNNPFSRQNLLERQLRQQHASQTIALTSQGHGYSGAVEALGKDEAFNQGAQRDELNRAYLNAVTGITSDLSETLTDIGMQGEGAIFDTAQSQAQDFTITEPGYTRRRHRNRNRNGGN